jgi:7-cyano-7-deazaguanine synthase
MKKTVVPNRNMVMLSAAASFAVSEGIQELYYGAHAGDHAIYPDCRREFVEAMQRAFELCDWTPLTLKAPFLDFTKADIVRLGLSLDVPFEKTWSCYKGGETACGRCGTCVERLLAFEEAGQRDPIAYSDRHFYKTVGA